MSVTKKEVLNVLYNAGLITVLGSVLVKFLQKKEYVPAKPFKAS